MAVKEFNHHSACLGSGNAIIRSVANRSSDAEHFVASVQFDFFWNRSAIDFFAVANFGSGLTIKHVDFDQEQLWYA